MMRRRYQHEVKQESSIVEERGSWDHPSYQDYHRHELSPPSIHDHKMAHQPSFQYSNSSYDHHDDHDDQMVFNRNQGWDDRSHGWGGNNYNQRMNNSNNFTVKKNEHQAMGAKTTILRPPLGSTNPPNHHQYRHHPTFYGEGSWQGETVHDGQLSISKMVKNNNNNSNANNNWIEASRKFGDYHNYNGRMKEDNGRNTKWVEDSRKFRDYDYDGRMREDNSSNNDNKKSMAVSRKFGDYSYNHVGGLREDLESLIKRMRESGFGGTIEAQVEVVEYERRRASAYGGSLNMVPPYYNN